jgi:hypothetical protein
MEDIFDFVSGWAVRTEKMLRENIDKKGVIDSKALKASLSHSVERQQGGIRITFQFSMTGKFTDMGAGRGQKANTKTTKRKQKVFYRKTYFGRKAALQRAVFINTHEEIRRIIKAP